MEPAYLDLSPLTPERGLGGRRFKSSRHDHKLVINKMSYKEAILNLPCVFLGDVHIKCTNLSKVS